MDTITMTPKDVARLQVLTLVKDGKLAQSISAAQGLMVLWDGSPHPWFGPTEPACTLMAAIEDADGELLEAFFCPQETSLAYLKLLEGIVRKKGLPTSIYQDRHSALKRTDSH